jgi:hypothetical protein
MSSQDIAHELFNDIIDSIETFGECERRQELFTFNAHIQVRQDASPVTCSPLLVYHSPRSITSRRYTPKELLLDKLPKHKILSALDTDYHKVHIYQMKVVRQRTNAVCGYHALFNSIQALRVLQSNTLEEQNWHLEHMMDRTCFWFFYTRVQRLFTEYARSQEREFYPWSSKNIDLGLFEREYMKYILEKETKQIEAIGRDKFTSIPDLSVRSLKNGILTTNQMQSIQKIFDRFLEAPAHSDLYHAFCLGSGNHWFSFVIHQHRDESETTFEGLYLDSRNNALFGQSDEQLRQQVLDRLETSLKRDPTKYTDFYKEMYIYNYFESLKDTQFSVELILECIKGKKNFMSVCVRLLLEDLLDRFYNEVTMKCTEENDSMLKLIHQWMLNFFPPSFIANGIVTFIQDLGVHYVESDLKENTIQWINLVLAETSEEKLKNISTEEVVEAMEPLRIAIISLQDLLCEGTVPI